MSAPAMIDEAQGGKGEDGEKLLWIATVTAMAASWSHLAHWLASWEHEGWVGILAGAAGATAIDLGLLAAMRRVGVLARRGAPTDGPRHTVWALTAVSALANVMNASAARLARPGEAQPDDWMGWAALYAGATLAAGVLPLIVLRLTELLETYAPAPEPEHAPEHAPEPAAPLAPAPAVAEKPRTRAAPRRTAQRATKEKPRAAGEGAPSGEDARLAAIEATRRAASEAPFGSQRELARLAGIGETTIRRMIERRELAATTSGWQVTLAP